MIKNYLNRERLEKIKSWRETYGAGSNVILPAEEAEELSCMALAAMDSEPVAWGNGCDKTVPAALRYLAENERPFGGESRFNAAHLYQLAREIELMAEAPLYRHAQQPVVPDDVLDALQKVARIRLDLNDFDGDRRGIADCLGDAEEALIEVVNRRAAMLQELQKSAGAANNCRSNKNVQDLQDESRCGIKSAPPLDFLPKNTESRCSNSPVIPDGYVMVPVEPNGDMLAAAQDAYGETDGDIASTLRAAMLAAAPQEEKSE